MGIGSKVKKSVKKAAKSVSKSVSHLADKAKRESNRVLNKATQTAGVQGTFAGDVLTTLGQWYLHQPMLTVIDDTTRLATGQSGNKQKIMNDIAVTEYSGFQRQAEKQAALAKAAGEADARAARDAEQAAMQAAILQKNALIAEQESAQARPVQEGYLAPAGSLGKYVKETKKKRLGGDK